MDLKDLIEDCFLALEYGFLDFWEEEFIITASDIFFEKGFLSEKEIQILKHIQKRIYKI